MTIVKSDYENRNCPLHALSKDYDERLKREERLRLELKELEQRYINTTKENRECEVLLAKFIGSNCTFLSEGRVMFAKANSLHGYDRIEIKQAVK